MSGVRFDKILKKTVDDETIFYGIIFGNEKIVFIKTGADGKILGADNKYLNMAYRAYEKSGATVICSTNPFIEIGHLEADKALISDVAREIKCDDYSVCMFGTSDGAYHNLKLANKLSQTAKILCVNTSTYDIDALKEMLVGLSHVEKIFVYGDKDDEYEYVPHLNELQLDRFKVVTVEGADHHFKGMVNEFIGLIDLI